MTSDLWVVYVLECSDGTFYTGATNNIERRLKAHNSKRGAKYTRSRTPCTLIAQTDSYSKSQCLKIERRFKLLPRHKKIKFIELGFTSFLVDQCSDLFPKHLDQHDHDRQDN